MGTHNLSGILTSIVMIVLFTIAIIGFSVGFATDNNAYVSVYDDQEMNTTLSNARQNMSTLQGESDTTYGTILNTTIEPGSDVIRSPAVFVLTVPTLLNTFSNIFRVGYKTVFGSGEDFGIFFSVLVTVFVLLISWYVIKAIRGNP